MNLPDIAAHPALSSLIARALEEDLGPERLDVTSAAMVEENQRSRARLMARDPGVLSGGPVAAAVFKTVDPQLEINLHVQDGEPLQPGDAVLTVCGSTRAILTAERTALNFIQRMTGIATLTTRYVAETAGTKAKILDTRKTTPGLRVLEKYAVRCGGGENHRMGLYDMAMIKDNHLAYWSEQHDSGPAGAVAAVRARFPGMAVELEVDTLEQLKAALPARPDRVLLDNMAPETLRECVRLCAGICETEASGGITLATLRAAAESGVDYISIGALTHSAPSADLALDFDETP